GTLYHDINGNGTREAGEPGINNQTVYVDANDNGALDPDELRAVTSGGSWSIPRLAAGTYRLRQVLQTHWRQTAPGGGNGAAHEVTVAAGQQVTGVNFGTARIPAEVVGRHVFYNRSSHDGGDAAANSADDNAIAADKSALLPGGAATFSNVTSYSRGINGVMIDVNFLTQGVVLGAGDFAVAVGGDGGWSAAPPPAVNVRRGAGVGGSDRITLTWPDDAIRNTWLRVTMPASPRTGLVAPEVFYFGHLAGETGDSTAAGRMTVSPIDLRRTQRALFSDVAVNQRYDFNRDGRISVLDLAIVRLAQRRSLALLGAPAAPAPAVPPPPVGRPDAPDEEESGLLL
ncbi:MAG TPA: hypothetical protein VFB66_27940, partial [Tepidisphaeraceae bacterium]|nr:hypothetical protein [Tepidisphaeraceae bacterium]